MEFINLPNPLHPAIVHFPIAFVTLGTCFALIAVIFSPIKLSQFSAILLTLGAFGVYFAMEAGEDSYDAFKTAFPHAKSTLNTHADWADRTHYIALLAALFSIVTLLTAKKRILFRVFRIITAVAALGTLFFVYKTAELGGHMVYHEALKFNPESPELHPEH